MSPEQIGETISRCQETGYLPDGSRKCLLCADQCPDEPMYVGMWVADKATQRRLGCSEERLANGGGRVVLYQLCPGCFERPSAYEAVEAEILRQVSVQ
jgi:hypothetical protein